MTVKRQPDGRSPASGPRASREAEAALPVVATAAVAMAVAAALAAFAADGMAPWLVGAGSAAIVNRRRCSALGARA